MKMTPSNLEMLQQIRQWLDQHQDFRDETVMIRRLFNLINELNRWEYLEDGWNEK